MVNKYLLNETWKMWDKLNSSPGFFTVLLFIEQLAGGRNNIDYLVQAVPALGKEKWAEKAQSAPSGSLQPWWRWLVISHMWLPLCQEFRRQSVESMKSVESGDPALSGSTGKAPLSWNPQGSRCGPQGSQGAGSMLGLQIPIFMVLLARNMFWLKLNNLAFSGSGAELG